MSLSEELGFLARMDFAMVMDKTSPRGRDWRGLVDLMGFSYEMIVVLQTRESPTLSLLEEWERHFGEGGRDGGEGQGGKEGWRGGPGREGKKEGGRGEEVVLLLILLLQQKLLKCDLEPWKLLSPAVNFLSRLAFVCVVLCVCVCVCVCVCMYRYCCCICCVCVCVGGALRIKP